MFLAFSAFTLLGALMLLCMRSLVLAALSLVMCFLGLAGLFLLLSNPVAAMLQVIVYSGAIVVLVLFVIMLLNEHREEAPLKRRLVQNWGSLLLLLGLGTALSRLITSSQGLQALAKTASTYKSPLPAISLERIGQSLFKEQVLAFEITGLILLAAMVAAVTLVKREL